MLDSAQAYPFMVELKASMIAINSIEISVTVTSNHSIEELMEHTTEARKEACRRRFTIVEVRWRQLSTLRILDWKISKSSDWKLPAHVWCDPSEQVDEPIKFHKLE
jgi:hypothetical protein